MSILISIISKNNDQKEYELKNSCKIGRSSCCNIIINDPLVSGEHLEIKYSSSGIVIVTDLNSHNGTFLNGELIEEEILKINDRLFIGETKISICPQNLTEAEREQIGERTLELCEKKKIIKRMI